MSQNVNLSLSGLYTAPSNFQGLPPGALTVADNVEIRYKNVTEPRRGFEGLPYSMTPGRAFKRLSSFYVLGQSRIVALTLEGDAVYYNGSDESPTLIIQDLTYVANLANAGGEAVTIRYTAGASLVVSVSGAAISVQLNSGVSTATLIAAAVLAFPAAAALVNVVVSGTGSNVQVPFSFTEIAPWPLLPGSLSQDIQNPNDVFSKSRFLAAGQNLYITALDGPRSLASGDTSQLLRAGVPKALNLEGEVIFDPSQDGFLPNNTVLITTGNISSGSPSVTNLESSTGVLIGQYVTGDDVPATLVVQDLTYTAVPFGVLGNAVTIAYINNTVLSVGVVGSAITVQINTGVSTGAQVKTAIEASMAASALVTVAVTGTGSNVQVAAAATPFTGGLDNSIPAGTTVTDFHEEEPIIIETGDLTATNTSILNVSSISGLVAGVLVSGVGIIEGTKVASATGSTVVVDQAPFITGTGILLTFSSPPSVTMSQNALITLTSTPITFYRGAQVAYKILYGRLEDDRGGGSITRLGSPSTPVIVVNDTPFSVNVELTATLPKNSQNEINFVQLYRSNETQSATISPLDQYRLVYERQLVAGDFSSRTISIEDETPYILAGIPLYTGSDQEGALQANDPPPLAWDMTTFRDFAFYTNITRPTTLELTILAVGAPNGLQVGDTITIAGDFLGASFSETYTASSSEDQATRQFQVFSSGSPAQNITDTAQSFIRVVNYDEDLPVHAIYISPVDELSGQILLEADHPSYDQFTTTASAHQDSYDPPLNTVLSNLNTIPNGIAVSKAGEIEAVPPTNIFYAGTSNFDCLRAIGLRDYTVIFKTDSIYKIQGLSPNQLVVSPFSLTTKLIGPDTACAFNDGAWAFTNQGVVAVNDGGVDLKSIPIDSDLNLILGNHLQSVIANSFALGYESDRKYILFLPESDNPHAEIEYNFNYISNAWTTWDRNFYAAFIHPIENLLYVSCADQINMGVSKERKTGLYTDYVDESYANTVVSIDGTSLVLDSVENVDEGDIFFQSDSLFSPILEVNELTSTITVAYDLDYTTGACQILKSYPCTVTWMQVFGENPAFLRQFSEGIVLFKNTRFFEAALSFVTDFSQGLSEVPIFGQGNSLWGLFPWGLAPWGGSLLPANIRFIVPGEKQYGSYIKPTLTIQQGYSNFILQGLSLSYSDISQEAGRL